MSGILRNSNGDGREEDHGRRRPWSIGSELLGHYQDNSSVPDDQGSQRRLHNSHITEISQSNAVVEIHNGTQVQDKEENESNMEGGPPRLVRARTTVINRVLTDWWWWELFSWLVSFLATGAIVVVLLLYNERPLPRWPLGFTINAYISVLAALAKAAMILPVSEAIGQLKWLWFKKESKLVDFLTFDSASRGPWGSLMLLGTTKCRHLAAIGAAITILALAFETMFQQIVAYPERPVIVGNASVAIAQSFHVNLIEGDIPSLGTDPQTATFIDTAIFGDNNTFTPPPSICPSGDCSWPVYSSLAVCNQCKDVSDLLYYQCQNSTTVNLPGGFSTSRRTCGWMMNNTLMIGFDMNVEAQRSYYYLSMQAVATKTMDDVQRDNPKFNSTHFKYLAYPLLDLYVAYTPGGLEAVKKNDTPKMVECLMSWCVQSYKGVHQNGVLNETVISTYMDPTTSRVSEADLEKGKQPVVLSPPNVNGTFTVSNSTTEAVRRKLMFSQNNNGGALTPISFTGGEDDNFTSYKGIYNFIMVPPYDISPGLDNIASSITNSMRRKTNGTELTPGSAWAPQTFVQIRWVWITLPAVLLVFTFIFLVGTIIESVRQNVTVWKTSILAVLLHGLSGDSGHNFDPETPASEVEAAAQKIQVVLSSEKEMSRLVMV